MRSAIALTLVLALAGTTVSIRADEKAGPIERAAIREVARMALEKPESPRKTQSDWNNVRALEPGRAIMLEVKDGLGSVRVQLQSADEEGLAVLVGKEVQRRVRRDDVLEIRYPETFYARQGLLVGLANGAIMGALLGALSGRSAACAGFGAMSFGGLGLGIGAAVGGVRNAAAHQLELVYRAPGVSPGLSGAAILGR